LTALVAFTLAGRAYLGTDGASTVAGLVVSYAPKVQFFPHLNCAVLIRGRFATAQRIRAEFGRAATMNAVLERLPERMASAFRFRHHFPISWNWDLAIASYDDGEPRVYVMSSFDRPSAPRFQLRQDDGLFLSPPPDDRPTDEAWATINDGFVNEGVMQIIDAQRRNGSVGAYAAIASVGADGFRSELLKTYPDRMGKKIDPATGFNPPPKVVGLISSSWR
jgi:hypothetical protein